MLKKTLSNNSEVAPYVVSLIFMFFMASGFSALIYQVAWVRILSVVFGTTIYAISTVLTIFMAGLALGSYYFGKWIDRWPRPLLVYGILELFLAVYVALLVVAMPWIQEMTVLLLKGRELSHASTSLIKFVITSLILLPPTTLMGGTLPVLAKFVTKSSKTIGKSLGLLYGVNTLGAVFGSLVAAYVLIMWLGINRTILLAVSITALVGIASFALGMKKAFSQQAEFSPTDLKNEPSGYAAHFDVKPVSGIPGSRLPVLYAIAFGSGFATLAVEVLWTRLFINFFSSNVLVFATILGAFLTGIALGSFLVSRWVDRLRALDVAVCISILASAVLLSASVVRQGNLGMLFQKIHELESLSMSTKVYLLLGLMFLLVALAATVFGTILPSLFRWCSRSVTTLGRDIGRLYALNTIGSIAGSFAAGFLMIPYLGLNASLLLLGLFYGILAILVVRQTAFRVVSGVITLSVLILVLIPSVRRPIYWFNGGNTMVRQIPSEWTLFLEEGIEGTVGVSTSGDFRVLTVNGITVAESSLHDIWDLLLKAHLPMLIHENPRQVALVGLGAGISLGAVASYREPEHIDTIEIAPEILPAHRLFESVNRRAWEDPRLNLYLNDGRHFLLTTDNRYDVISVDPTDPPVVYQYTQDFMQLCHDRLADGGIMVQWVPLFHLSSGHLKIIMKAFLNVFSESTTLWYDGTSVLLMGRRGMPLDIDVQLMKKRLLQPGVRSSMAMIGNPDVWRLLSTYVAGYDVLRIITKGDVPENSDNRPYLEYAILRSAPVTSRTFAANLEMFESHLESAGPLLGGKVLTSDNIQKLAREELIMKRLLRMRIHKMHGEQIIAKDILLSLIQDEGVDEAEFKSLWPFWK
jgi:spermidine synthase